MRMSQVARFVAWSASAAWEVKAAVEGELCGSYVAHGQGM